MNRSRSARLFGRLKSVGFGVTAVGAAVLLSACTMIPFPPAPIATTPPASTAPAARNTETATAAWEVALDPIGQPVVADGVALVYAKTATGVNAHAFSVADGKQLWTQPVHPGLEAVGVPLEPAVTRTAGGRSAAIFLQAAAPPADDGGVAWWTSPVAFDLRTGKELYRGREELVSTRPFACDDLQEMCFIAYDETSQSVEHWVDLESGEDLAGPEINPLPGNFRPVGKQLYSVVADGIETLAHVSFGEVLWEVEIETVFGKGATTDMGWHFNYSEKLDLYVGSVGINPTNFSPDKFTEQSFSLNLRETTKTVGLRASSGRVLWTAEGTQLECAKTLGTAASKLGGGDGYPVRCEYVDGHIEFPAGTYRGSHSKVVGYDPLTGKAAWESKPVEVHSWETTGLIPSASHGDFVITGHYADSTLVDTRTGKFRGASFQDGFVCWEETTYTMPLNGPNKDQPGGGIAAGSRTAFPCLKSGSPAPSLTYGALTDVSTVDSDMAVISFKGKVAGYKLLKEFV
ncbi:PQQ-binding-like beta-propeller repeat protein [Paenarthrobacter aurescens]|uniref:Lipoprotein n=1 Tax=Paenarthrobacter aurescens (strain TC1) TaxID=290340 RepID=A1R9K5_PAEAT|nr:PQQ-binding-like beta-propeller repeat protein [Paenarthrobacter aurescens]ABM10250.1 putative lipoprotein [Paenarthrobacter aurescens TC1]